MDHFTPASTESKKGKSLSEANSSGLASIRSLALLFFTSFLYLCVCDEGNLISHIFRENEICRDTEWERYFCYKGIEVPDSYDGPHITFPMTFCGVSKLVEAFKQKQVGAPAWWNKMIRIKKKKKKEELIQACQFIHAFLFFSQ